MLSATRSTYFCAQLQYQVWPIGNCFIEVMRAKWKWIQNRGILGFDTLNQTHQLSLLTQAQPLILSHAGIYYSPSSVDISLT